MSNRKTFVLILLLFLFSFGLINCRKDTVDYGERLERIKRLKDTNQQAYVTHLGNLLQSLEKDDPLYKEALELMIEQLIENARLWEDRGRYSEAADIYLQAIRMDRDNQKLRQMWGRARAFSDLTVEDFEKILIGMQDHELLKITGNPYEVKTTTINEGTTVHHYHFLTKANKWDFVVITLDESMKVIEKRYPEIIEEEEEKE